ncbi:MAG TPA: TlpA disulfide reductase family protein [Blastocatellia bacterium]|nr:TlpA disulfide reductase family protein [Blastocatellia bacterium]
MKAFLAGILLCLSAMQVAAQRQGNAPVTLTGQVVCSECWFEADRKTTPYGTAADLKCAVRCARTGVPQALAVLNGDEYALYMLEKGKFKKDFLDYVGKRAEVTGATREKDGKQYLKVDDLKVLTSESKETQSQSEEKSGAPPTAPEDAPELNLNDLSGVQQSLHSYRDKNIVVLNFWATWCVPCRVEMPMLVDLQKKYAARGVQVIAASADDASNKNAVEKFARRMKLNFPVWVGATTDELKLFKLGTGLPATVIIDRNGQIVGRIMGLLDKADLESRIEWLLGDRSTPAPAAVVNNLEKRDDGHGHEGEEEHDHGGVGVEGASSVPS